MEIGAPSRYRIERLVGADGTERLEHGAIK